jgi:hypothetical protein
MKRISIAGLLGTVMALVGLVSMAPVNAQEPDAPAEQDLRVTLVCGDAQASSEGHLHVAGGPGRPTRYVVLPALACDVTRPLVEARIFWWPGSIWYVILSVESAGDSVHYEEEGTQPAAVIRCPTVTGAVVFTIEPATAATDAFIRTFGNT